MQMSHDQILREISSVLAILPDVIVESIDITPANTSMTLCVNLPNSLAVVVYTAEGANFPLHLWTEAPDRSIGTAADGKYLRYRLSSCASAPSVAIETFTLFGCFIVRYLFGADLMAKSDANVFLEKWDGELIKVTGLMPLAANQ